MFCNECGTPVGDAPELRPQPTTPHLAEVRTTYASLGAIAWLEDLERALAEDHSLSAG